MRIINDSNMFDDYILELKNNLGFEQVLFKENTPHMIFFDCLREGQSYEVRYIIRDETYEIFIDNRWIEL